MSVLIDADDFINASELAAIMDDHPSVLLGGTADETNVGADDDELVVVASPDDDNNTTREETEEERRARKRARKESKRAEKEARRRAEKGARKEKSRKVSKFIDDAASDAASDEGSEALDDGEGEDYELDAEEAANAAERHKRSRHQFTGGDDGKTAEEIAAEIEQRHALEKQKRNHKKRLLTLKSSGGGGGVSSGLLEEEGEWEEELVPRRIPIARRFSAAFLPRETDPKVFAVKCKPGMARLLVTRIVNKCFHYRTGQNDEKRKLDLGILAVFALEHSKEYIYVESYRQLFVEQALNGLVGLYRYNIKAVAPDELMQLMEPRHDLHKALVRVGTFVRIRSPKVYQGDLAQVLSVDEDGKRATVKVIPREDFVDKRYSKATVRLAQRFFDATLAVGSHSDGEYHRWGDLTFDNEGYLHKSVSMRGLLYGDQLVAPTTEELARFLHNKRDQIAVAANSLAASGAVGLVDGGGRRGEFKLGEVVRVVSGQLANAVGTIADVTLSTNTVTLSCKVPGRAQPLQVRAELNHCERYFVAGNHVGVEQGVHLGRTGTVVKVIGDGLLAVLADGRDADEFEVRARDCRQSRLVNTARHSLGSWNLFDLVMLVDGVTVGCVVRCAAQHIVIITTANLSQTVSPSEVKSIVRTAGRPAIDRMHNPVSRGSVVTILATNDRVPSEVVNTVATVEQLFDQTLFVRCTRLTEHSGIIAIPPTLVQLVGGKTTTKTLAPMKSLPTYRNKGHYASKPDSAATQQQLGGGAASEEWGMRSEYYEPA